MDTLSVPAGWEVHTPPCFTQNEQPQARAAITAGSGSQLSVKAMLPQWQRPRISTSAVRRRLVPLGCLRAGAEEELLHLGLEELARLGLHRRQAVFVDEHGLVPEPLRPGLARDPLEDALSELARVGRPLQARRLALQDHTLHHAGHGSSGVAV